VLGNLDRKNQQTTYGSQYEVSRCFVVVGISHRHIPMPATRFSPARWVDLNCYLLLESQMFVFVKSEASDSITTGYEHVLVDRSDRVFERGLWCIGVLRAR
jgi:hypothetical protein